MGHVSRSGWGCLLTCLSLTGCGAFDGLFGGGKVTYDSIRLETYQSVGNDPLDGNAGGLTGNSIGNSMEDVLNGIQQTDGGRGALPQQNDGGLTSSPQGDGGARADEYNVRARVRAQCEVGEIDLLKLAIRCDVARNLILTYRDGENEKVLKILGALREVGDLNDFVEKLKTLSVDFAATAGGGDVFLCIDGNGNGRCGDETVHNLNDFNDLLTVFQRSQRLLTAGRGLREQPQGEVAEGDQAGEDAAPVIMSLEEICSSPEVSLINQGLVLYHMHHGRESQEEGLTKSSLLLDQIVAAKVAGILRNIPEPEQGAADLQAAGGQMGGDRLARLLGEARDRFGLNENGIQDFLARRNRVIQLAMAVDNCQDIGRRTDGCFAEGTQIQLNARYRLPVEALQVGDQVLLANGERSSILEIVKGPEAEPMVNLRLSDGRELSVTTKHPMWTERGLLRAEDLTLSDRLYTQEGFALPLAALDRRPTARPVYNLRLMGFAESDHLVIANGVVSGDLYLQEQLRGGVTPNLSWAGF